MKNLMHTGTDFVYTCISRKESASKNYFEHNICAVECAFK